MGLPSSSPPASTAMAPMRRFYAGVALVVAVGLVSLAVAVQAASAAGATHASGLFQGDMPTYLCFAESAHPETAGLTYQSPHDLAEPGEGKHLVNLPITLLYWLRHMGLSPAGTAMTMRWVFGIGMFLLLAAWLRVSYRRERTALWALAFIAGGGGFVWLAATVGGYGHPWDGEARLAMSQAVMAMEGRTYWWFLQLFRNLWYPLELAYHCLVFGLVWALTVGRYRWALALQALACLSNPFVGIQASLVALGVLAVVAWRGPKDVRHGARRALVGSLVLAGALALYYGLWLGLDPVVASLQSQHRGAHSDPLDMKLMARSYGPALLGFPVALWVVGCCLGCLGSSRSLDSRGGGEWTLLPAAVLTLATFLLTQHTRWVDGLMPLHFARGYLHTGLWALVVGAAARLRWAPDRQGQPDSSSNDERGIALRVGRALSTKAATTFGVLVLVAAWGGTALFLAQQVRQGPGHPNLVWEAEHAALHAPLAAAPSGLRVAVDDRVIGPHLCGLMGHRSAFGTPLTTPFYAERQAQLRAFALRGEESALSRWADTILVPVGAQAAGMARRSGWRRWFQTGRWVAFRRERSGDASPVRSTTARR